MSKRYIITIILFFFIKSFSLVAEKKPDKIRIAVSNLTKINAEDINSVVYRNILEVTLFNAKNFILLEREQLNIVFNELKIKNKESTSIKTSTIIAAGKLISADYIVYGNIEKRNKYIITIKLISVKGAKIINVYNVKTDKNNIYEKIKGIAYSIIEDLKNKHSKNETKKTASSITEDLKNKHSKNKTKKRNQFSISYQVNYLYPVGEFNDIIKNAYGLTLNFSGSKIFSNFHFGLLTGFYYGTGKTNKKDTALFIPLCLTAHYNFQLYKKLYLSPVISIGAEGIILKHKDDPGFEDMEENSTKYGFDPLAMIGLKAGFYYSESLQLELGAEFGTLFEPSENLYFLNFNFGVVHRL